ELNRRGPLLTAAARLDPLPAAQVRRLLADTAVVLDVRPVVDYAAGHIPNSVAIPLRAQFATWLGWLIDPDVPVVIVRNPDQDPADIVWPAAAVGYFGIIGELVGGIGAWTRAGGDLATARAIGPSEVDTPVVDVRQSDEYAEGHLPGAQMI